MKPDKAWVVLRLFVTELKPLCYFGSITQLQQIPSHPILCSLFVPLIIWRCQLAQHKPTKALICERNHTCPNPPLTWEDSKNTFLSFHSRQNGLSFLLNYTENLRVGGCRQVSSADIPLHNIFHFCSLKDLTMPCIFGHIWEFLWFHTFNSSGLRHYVFWLSVCASVPLLWMECLRNALREFLQIWHEYPLRLKHELLRIWWSKVKVTVTINQLVVWS